MQTNYSNSSSFYYRNQTTVTGGFEELEAYVHHNDGVDLTSPSCSIFSLRSPNDMSLFPNNTIYNNAIPFNASSEKVGGLMYEYDHEQLHNQKSCSDDVVSVDTTNQQNDNNYHSGDIQNDKTLRRLAQNRQAAKKSRLRKKAYVEQLESSRERLSQLEQELQLARQQHGGFSAAASGFSGTRGAAAVAFDAEYARWVEEHQRLINDLRAAASSDSGSDQADLRLAVEGVMGHYDRMFRLKSMGTKADVFHILSGMWKTPAERCFMWLGGFRSSELLKILGNHLEPLTEHQLMGICNLQQSSQQAEDALSQGMEALQQSLAQSLSSTSASADVAEYMNQMGVAMAKLGTLESLVHQADLLTHQTLWQMHRILTTRQAARALLLLNDYFSRLRALSSLWLARPTDVNPAF